MFASLSLLPLLAIFALAACAIWLAGVKLSNTTDVLSERLGMIRKSAAYPCGDQER
jgi:cation:H+ antiporter